MFDEKKNEPESDIKNNSVKFQIYKADEVSISDTVYKLNVFSV